MLPGLPVPVHRHGGTLPWLGQYRKNDCGADEFRHLPRSINGDIGLLDQHVTGNLISIKETEINFRYWRAWNPQNDHRPHN